MDFTFGIKSGIRSYLPTERYNHNLPCILHVVDGTLCCEVHVPIFLWEKLGNDICMLTSTDGVARI